VLSDAGSGVSDDADLRQMTILNPTELENSVLESDGRVGRSDRPPGNPWKRLTLWRWRDGFVEEVLLLGGFTPGEAPAHGGREVRRCCPRTLVLTLTRLPSHRIEEHCSTSKAVSGMHISYSHNRQRVLLLRSSGAEEADRLHGVRSCACPALPCPALRTWYRTVARGE
jgi:hypothetical protein